MWCTNAYIFISTHIKYTASRSRGGQDICWHGEQGKVSVCLRCLFKHIFKCKNADERLEHIKKSSYTILRSMSRVRKTRKEEEAVISRLMICLPCMDLCVFDIAVWWMWVCLCMMNGNERTFSFSWVIGNIKGLMLDPSAPTICSAHAHVCMFGYGRWMDPLQQCVITSVF